MIDLYYKMCALSSDEQFRDTIRKYLEMSEDDRYNYFSNGKRNTNNNNHVMKASQKKVLEFESDYDLWGFLEKNKDVILHINDWKVYRRAVETVKESFIETVKPVVNEKLLDLLNRGDIEQFNRLRSSVDYLSLRGIDLSKMRLHGANLSGCDLRETNLRETDLSSAFLTTANLYDANLSYANLHRAVLHRAQLIHCNLYNTNLKQTDLSSANLSESDCSEADLELANMSSAILKLTNLRSAKNLPIPKQVAAEKGALI
jgi:hypothetical protein